MEPTCESSTLVLWLFSMPCFQRLSTATRVSHSSQWSYCPVPSVKFQEEGTSRRMRVHFLDRVDIALFLCTTAKMDNCKSELSRTLENCAAFDILPFPSSRIFPLLAAFPPSPLVSFCWSPSRCEKRHRTVFFRLTLVLSDVCLCFHLPSFLEVPKKHLVQCASTEDVSFGSTREEMSGEFRATACVDEARSPEFDCSDVNVLLSSIHLQEMSDVYEQLDTVCPHLTVDRIARSGGIAFRLVLNCAVAVKSLARKSCGDNAVSMNHTGFE